MHDFFLVYFHFSCKKGIFFLRLQKTIWDDKKKDKKKKEQKQTTFHPRVIEPNHLW